MLTAERDKLTEPLESVTAFLGSLLLFALTAYAVFAAVTGQVGSFGSVCVTQPGVQYADSGWSNPYGVAARPGASDSIVGAVQVCALHSGIGQDVLYALTVIPAVAFWGVVLLLLWRMIVLARRAGPFTPAVATAMRRLGWLIIAGSATVAVVRAIALNQLLNAMLVAPGSDVVNVVVALARGLFPVPALTSAALLTFARIIRLGVRMDDDIKGTV